MNGVEILPFDKKDCARLFFNIFINTKNHVRLALFTWPKNFVFGQVLFSSARMCLCVCVCVCVCVSVYIDYLKKFLTDFDETWQDDL